MRPSRSRLALLAAAALLALLPSCVTETIERDAGGHEKRRTVRAGTAPPQASLAALRAALAGGRPPEEHAPAVPPAAPGLVSPVRRSPVAAQDAPVGGDPAAAPAQDPQDPEASPVAPEDPLSPLPLVEPPATPSAAPLLDGPIGSEVLRSQPGRILAHQKIRAADGRFTRLYWLRAGTGERIQALVLRHTRAGDPALAVLELSANALADPRVGPGPAPLNTLIPSTGQVSDLLTITATDDVLEEVDEFLTALLTGTPMIQIEANVVEITSADSLSIGTNFSLEEGGTRYAKKSDGTPDFSQPVGNQDDKGTLFDDFSFTDLGTQNFTGASGQLSLAILQDDHRLRAVIRALQDTGNATLLSAPKMAVLNGHRAVIDTGQKTPVLQPVLNQAGLLTQVQVKYEDTGIFLVVTPYLLVDDMIQIDVTAEVSAVTGFIESGASGILNPIINNRNASTVVNIRDGGTFAIGGLLATDEIEQVTKIPVLGDIPVLGYLFKTRSITERQSQVIFILKPTILREPPPIVIPEPAP